MGHGGARSTGINEWSTGGIGPGGRPVDLARRGRDGDFRSGGSDGCRSGGSSTEGHGGEWVKEVGHAPVSGGYIG
ncbi:pollen-specific leucine-rich repeat extensin-like protein 4 [Iris pallida]|uniref:Pollen-specific leucine-rich repeat extensin-like protein 4 n=1 Tax=Iris pallida TaxID=29817 RepID=A0AAX6HE99_IRIPA|nr:pollen-specific leucine-rich repeat extensin-like protein 4 [Iris pallida]